MQKLFLLTVFALLLLTACNQKNTSNTVQVDSVLVSVPAVILDSTLYKTIYAFVEAYENKSNAEVNKFIHPNLGLTIIHRPGVMDVFSQIDSFSFNDPIPDYREYESIENKFVLAFDALPEFDCGLEKWNKEGFFCDTTVRPNQFTQIIDFEKEFERDKYTEEFIDQIKLEEKESYRVILTSDFPLIFHVRKYQGSWFVTVLDRAYAGCDA